MTGRTPSPAIPEPWVHPTGTPSDVAGRHRLGDVESLGAFLKNRRDLLPQIPHLSDVWQVVAPLTTKGGAR